MSVRNIHLGWDSSVGIVTRYGLQGLHWGRDSSVIGEPGHTLLYVELLSVWGSVEGDLMFFPICRRAPFWGLQQTYMNE